MSLRRPRNRTRARSPASATAASTAGRSGPSPTIQATASGRSARIRGSARTNTSGVLGGLSRWTRLTTSPAVGDALGGPERLARGRVERRHRPQVDAGADDERLAPRHRGRRQDAEREALGEILPGHEHGGVAERAREPLEPDEERPPPVDGVVEGPAVDRLERDRDAAPGARPGARGSAPWPTARGPAAAGAGGGAPPGRRGRGGPARARARGPGSACGVVRHPARGDLRVVVALGPGVLAEDEVVVDGGRAPIVAGRQEGDLLGAPDDHPGDDVDDTHRHRDAVAPRVSAARGAVAAKRPLAARPVKSRRPKGRPRPAAARGPEACRAAAIDSAGAAPYHGGLPYRGPGPGR